MEIPFVLHRSENQNRNQEEIKEILLRLSKTACFLEFIYLLKKWILTCKDGRVQGARGCAWSARTIPCYVFVMLTEALLQMQMKRFEFWVPGAFCELHGTGKGVVDPRCEHEGATQGTYHRSHKGRLTRAPNGWYWHRLLSNNLLHSDCFPFHIFH